MALQWVAETSLRGPKGEDGGTSPHAARHATGGSDPVTPASIGAALDTDTVHRTGTETISGIKTVPAGAGNTWAFQQPPQIEIGTAADHPVRRDDPRLSDARTPTAHTHSAADITPAPVVTASGTGAYTVNADMGTDWYLTATGNRTLTLSGGYDGQMIVVDVLASGGARTITLSGVTLTTGMVSAFAIPSGKVGTIGLRRTNGTWRCLAQTLDT